jgi:hypothetical protein
MAFQCYSKRDLERHWHGERTGLIPAQHT